MIIRSTERQGIPCLYKVIGMEAHTVLKAECCQHLDWVCWGYPSTPLGQQLELIEKF